MKTWTPLKEGRFAPAALREPGAWACRRCRGRGWPLIDMMSWSTHGCDRCRSTGLYHGPALVECDLWGGRCKCRHGLWDDDGYCPDCGEYCPMLTPTEIAAVFGLFAATPHIQWIVPTREALSMRGWFEFMEGYRRDTQSLVLPAYAEDVPNVARRWPLPNVTLALRVSSQADLDAGVADLLACPAARRAVVVDGATERVDLTTTPARTVRADLPMVTAVYHCACAPEVVADLREQCQAARVPCEGVE